MKNVIAKIAVVLKITMNTNISKFISKVQSIYVMMLGNINFPSAQAQLTQFQTDITALVAAENKALTRVKGSAAARNAQKLIVFNEADALRGIVQSVVNIPANANNAVSIGQSAGMDIKGHSSKTKSQLSVKHGKVSGSVLLSAHAAGKHAAYKWAQGTDGINWVACNPDTTTESKTEVDGLAAGTTYYFRFQAVLPVKPGKSSSSTSAAQGEGN